MSNPLPDAPTFERVALPKNQRDQHWDKWREILNDKQSERATGVYGQLIGLRAQQQVLSGLETAMVEPGIVRSGYFLHLYRVTYVSAQAMTVRRLASTGRNDKRSLGSVIEDIARKPSVINRERYVNTRSSVTSAEQVSAEAQGAVDPANADSIATAERAAENAQKARAQADKEFTDRWSSESESEIDPGILAQDLRTLAEASKKVVDLADHDVAHISDFKAQTFERPTWGEINDAIDILCRTFTKYGGLLHDTDFSTDPVLPHWQQAFQHGLFDPDHESHKWNTVFIDRNGLTLVRLEAGDAPRLLKAVLATKDLADVAHWRSDDFDLAASTLYVRDSIRAWDAETAFRFNIEDPGSDDIVGGCVIECLAPDWQHAYVQVWIRPELRRRGAATAALRMAMKFAFDELGLKQLELRIPTNNEAAFALSRSVGAISAGTQAGGLRVRDRRIDVEVMILKAAETDRK